MKVKTRELDCSDCVLSQTEIRGIHSTVATCDQLAYHYRGSDFGNGMASVVSQLRALLNDTAIAPRPNHVEQSEERPNA